jgi:hypothetical protein
MTTNLDPYQPVPAVPKKKPRVFLWIFLGLQALFLIWLIGGTISAGHTTTTCGSLTPDECQNARALGTGAGFLTVLCVWAVVDVVVGGGYAVYRLARRP